MGWIREVDGLYDAHEGYVAFVTAAGQRTGSTSGGGVLVHDGATSADDVVVPWSQVVGWQSACACGWTGVRWLRTDVQEDPTYPWSEQALLPDGRTVEDAAHTDWAAHVDPFDRLAAVRAAAAAVGAARAQLDDAVRAARADEQPASWAEIGRATGMTRQSARERWDTAAGDTRAS